MAENIKIIGDVLNVNMISRYTDDDINLFKSQLIKKDFGGINDYIEFYLYDTSDNLLNLNYNYRSFKLPADSYMNPETGELPIIEIDPVADLKVLGYSTGEFRIQYNFFTNRISNNNAELFIKEISSDRTEIRVASVILSDEELLSQYESIRGEIYSSSYILDFLLNFGLNRQALAINVALNQAETGYEILFKLYEALDNDIVVKTPLWIVDEKVNPYSFEINLDTLIIPDAPLKLRGPNFSIPVDQNTGNTNYTNYNSLLTIIQNSSGSSYNQINNLLNKKSVEINVDYSDFSNFVFFGSAKSRLTNFYDKIRTIENYNSLITGYTADVATNPTLAIEITKAQNSISDIISNFDKYEYDLYFSADSYTWPKVNNTLPYTLKPSTDAAVISWYNALLETAEDYDSNNDNSLVRLTPKYLLEDSNNSEYLIFLNMMGQYFDNIWIQLKAVTDVNLADNNLTSGISKDLVYQTLKSFGIKLYNSYSGEDLDKFLIGSNSGSMNFVDDFSTDSIYLNNISRKDLQAELYKRIYHNLPYITKTKGTLAGLEAIKTIFGIPDEILSIKEYGGLTWDNGFSEVNTDKVRIVSNPITSKVLSPFIKLEEKSTNYNDVRSPDLHYVDASFSPQSQLDIVIEQFVITNHDANFNIHNYIGDPREINSNSYNDLDQLKKNFVALFTNTTYLDYNGFIRLIQFFDNSMFKMLEDFIPARVTLSTGISFNSPYIERNKFAYGNISNTENQTVYSPEIKVGGISSEYGTLFDKLAGTKAAFYNGEIEGSHLDLYAAYFIPANYNPYLDFKAPITLIERNFFNHSEFNVLLNNVSVNRKSEKRQKVDGNLLVEAHLQDSNLSLLSYNRSRYNGTKTTSAKLNIYTDGDKSFGKTASVDNHVLKVGLFSEVISNVYLGNDKNDVIIKYLVDKDGNLTELNKNNYNWVEVQNTFKKAENLTVSLFDVKKYSNQKPSEGIKPIYSSGYSYEAALYFSLESKLLSFQIPGFYPSFRLLAKNNEPSGSIGGAYPLSPTYKVVSNLFDSDDESSPVDNYIFGDWMSDNYQEWPRYIAPQDSSYDVTVDISMVTTEVGNASGYVTYAYEIYKNLTSWPTTDSPVATQERTYSILKSGLYAPLSERAYLKYDDDNSSPDTVVTVGGGLRAENKSTYKANGIGSGDNEYQNDIQVWTDDLEAGQIIRITCESHVLDVMVDEDIMSGLSLSERTVALRNKVGAYINTYAYMFGGINDFSYTTTSANYFLIKFRNNWNSAENRISVTPYLSFKTLVGVDPIILTQDILDSLNNVALPAGTKVYKYFVSDVDLNTTVEVSDIPVYSTEPEIRLPRKINVNSAPYTPTLAGGQYTQFEYFYQVISNDFQLYQIPDNSIGSIINDGNNWDFNLEINNLFLKTSDILTFVFREKTLYSGFNYNINLTAGAELKVNGDPNILTIPNTHYMLVDRNLSIQSDPTYGGNTKLVFNADLSNIYINYAGVATFNPTPDANDILDIYNKYGDIDTTFEILPEDTIVIKDTSNYVYEFIVDQVFVESSRLVIILKSQIPTNVFEDLISTNLNKRYFEMLFLRRIKDETNAILSFKKRDGKTSYGFIIPQNLHPDVLKNIDTITKEVKQKLLDIEQSVIGGDTF